MIQRPTKAAGGVVQRVIRLAPAGRHTRYMLAAYLRQMVLVTLILLAIALTIDLWPQVDLISGGPGAGPGDAIWSMIRFSLLRTPDLVAPLLPFASFLAVLATEIAHTRSGERMLIWNSGRSPAGCLTPAILLGLILGPIEFALDAYLGPASMAIQMHERLGRDGQRLDRTRRDDSHWIALQNGLLSAEIEYGPPPILHHLKFFQLGTGSEPTEIDVAAEARQISGTDLWVMREGRFWRPDGSPTARLVAGPTAASASRDGEDMIPFTERTVSLAVNPLWLSVFGMEPQYLTLPVLRALARGDAQGYSSDLYQTRLDVLYGETILPGAMAVLAATLSILRLAYTTPSGALVAIVFFGYVGHAATKACLLMGQNGYLPPLVAGGFVPLALLAGTGVAFRVFRLTRRGAEPSASPVGEPLSPE